MIKINVFTIGKTKTTWLNEAIDIYSNRIKREWTIIFHTAKGRKELIEIIKNYSGIVALDPLGKSYDSISFAGMVEKLYAQNGSECGFIIGDADGLPEEITKAYPLVSLSKMTMTHDMVRLFLCEQLFRSHHILQGLPYHK